MLAEFSEVQTRNNVVEIIFFLNEIAKLSGTDLKYDELNPFLPGGI
jgi:hypothetical protein